MKYMGSKKRMQKEIAPILQGYIYKNLIYCYIDPFVGGSNMIECIKCENKIGSDNNFYLIEFMKKLQKGWNPLLEIEMTKQFYDDVKNNKNKYSPEVVALTGLCATYNAKWFGGYAGLVKTKIGTIRNYYDESVRNVMLQINKLKDVKYFHKNFEDYFGTEDVKVFRTLFYCDPPYQGTTKYKDEFNHEIFWEWVRKMSKNYIVIVSEYNAPDDFECIWNKEISNTLDKNSRSKAVEKLFILKQN